jgi:hypothetical protein
MKNSNTIATIIVIFCSLQFISCEISNDLKIEPTENNFIVINGQITNEKKEHTIIISRPLNQLNETSEPVTAALVTLYDGDLLYILKENLLKPGYYSTDSDFRGFINKTYTLNILANKQKYYSSTVMLPVVPFNPLKCKFDETKQMFTVDSVTEAFDNHESAIYEISIDWTQVPDYEGTPIESKKATLYYYMLSTLDVSEIFKPEKEKVYFPSGTTITEKKYSLTKQHAEFIRSLLLETEWRGGLFDVAQGNVKTNLSNGALGFFSASSVYQKIIVVN